MTAEVIDHASRGVAGPANATATVAATFGVVAALAGIEHGIGEILQGSIEPEGLVIESWPHTPAFAVLAGEPAMTIVPNLLATGILTILAAVALGAWSVGSAGRPHRGVGMIVLSVLLLVVGGGFGPPLVGIIAGIAVMRSNRRPARPPSDLRRAFGRLWPWFLTLGVVGFLGLMPGTVLLSGVWGVERDGLVVALSAVAFGGLIASLLAARARDRTIAVTRSDVRP